MRKSFKVAASAFASIALTASITGVAFAATVQGNGSSAMGTFQKTCTAAYTAHTVNYTASSSGTGRSTFAYGQVDFGGSDDPVKGSDPQRPSFGHIPVIAAPIAIGYNVPGVGSLKLDNKVLGAIFQGNIKKWNDSRIRALNSGVRLPNKNIVVAYRSSSSGTSGNFSGYLVANKVSGWTQNSTITRANGKGAPAGGLGFTSGGQLVTAVKSTKYSIGYADLADWKAQKFSKFASIKNPAGQFVQPTTTAATKFINRNTNVQTSGIVGLQWNKKVSGAYNLVLVAYMLVPQKDNYITKAGNRVSESQAAAVEDYTKYLLNTCGPRQAAKLGYIPIKGKMLTQARATAENIS